MQHGIVVKIEFAETVAQGFAPVQKSRLYHTDKQPLITVELLHLVAGHAQDARLYLGRRGKHMLIYRKQVLHLKKALQKHTQNTVFLRARSRCHTTTHLLLHHAHHVSNLVPVFKSLKKNLARNIVGKIADDGETLRKKSRTIYFKEVALHNALLHLRVVLVQAGYRLRIDSLPMHSHIAAFLQKLRKHPHS